MNGWHRESFASADAEFQFYLLRLKARGGNADAQFELGGMYLQCQVGRPSQMVLGGEPDYKQACKWFRRAAEQGHVEAQNSLGVGYSRGEGVPQDPTEACRWFGLAEENGSVGASLNLAMHYIRGLGVPKDFSKAVMRLKRVAEYSDPLAQYLLGTLYQKGHGVSKDINTAKKWYIRAAEQGFVPAQSMLGYMLMVDPQAEQAIVDAYVWLKLAAAAGDSDAKDNFLALEQRIDPALRSEAERLFNLKDAELRFHEDS